MKVTIEVESNSLINPPNSKNEKTTGSKINVNPNIEIKKERNSAFEILRILSMFFIILSHILYHTNKLPKLKSGNYFIIINNRYIFLRIISNFGRLGDNIFIMISGYFSIKKTTFHYKKFILLISEIYFYHYLLLYLSFKLIYKYPDIEPLQQKKGSIFMPLTSTLGHWFAQQYLVLLIFMPYINTGLLSLSQQQYKNFVVLLILCFSIIRPLLNCFEINTNLFSLVLFMKMCFIYIIGGFLRINDLINKKFILIIGAISFILIICFEIVCDNLAIYYKKFFWINVQKQLSLEIYSIFGILSAIGFIYLVKDFNYLNKSINFISSSVFGIYLIHANKNIAPFVYNAWFKTNDYNEEYFFVNYFLKTIIIFFVCLFIDLIRRFTIGIIIDKILIFGINFVKNILKY